MYLKMKNLFKNLFILDLANNHFGDVNHARKIIKKFSDISKRKKIKSAIKFQLRDYDTFIHKDFINSDDKYVRRFLDTKLEINEFKKLFEYVKKNKLLQLVLHLMRILSILFKGLSLIILK